MSPSLTESITRSLAYMLRHQPEEFDLELDAQGWGDLSEVVSALNERLGDEVEEEDVLEAIRSGDRPRYEVRGGRIRALYGHSFPIDPGEPSEPPERLYIGVGSRDADRAEERGLRAGRRAFLHLALDAEEAREMGRRIAPEYAVVTVEAREAWEEGIQFYDRQSLFLAERIPTEFLEVGEIQTDGHVRERRGGARDGDRDRDRGESRSRVRGRRGRSEDRPRRRPAREEAPPRRERPREDRPREEAPPRGETAREEAPPRRRTARPEPPPAPTGGFGAGILEGQRPPEPEELPAPAPEEPDDPPAEVREPEEEEAPPSEAPGGAPPGFGAGL